MAKRYFRFAARVLEHLGAELISSDDVAIYELVKNSFDAALDRNAPSTVTVAIQFHLDVHLIARLQAAIVRLLLPPDEAARSLSISPRTLWTLAHSGQIPFVRIGRLVRYSPADLQSWIESQKQSPEG